MIEGVINKLINFTYPETRGNRKGKGIFYEKICFAPRSNIGFGGL